MGLERDVSQVIVLIHSKFCYCQVSINDILWKSNKSVIETNSTGHTHFFLQLFVSNNAMRIFLDDLLNSFVPIEFHCFSAFVYFRLNDNMKCLMYRKRKRKRKRDYEEETNQNSSDLWTNGVLLLLTLLLSCLSSLKSRISRWKL